MARETTTEVADLRKKLSMGDLKIPQNEDVQSIAGAFKLYLKLLPEPILPCTVFKPLCQIIKKKFKGMLVQFVGALNGGLYGIKFRIFSQKKQKKKRIIFSLTLFFNKINHL